MKRMEAKAAVCLLAMSEGMGDYIRDVGKAVKEKLSPATRKHISEVLLPLLNTEYRKVRGPGIQPAIEYDQDMDGQLDPSLSLPHVMQPAEHSSLVSLFSVCSMRCDDGYRARAESRSSADAALHRAC